jgi:hypothetical protein
MFPKYSVNARAGDAFSAFGAVTEPEAVILAVTVLRVQHSEVLSNALSSNICSGVVPPVYIVELWRFRIYNRHLTRFSSTIGVYTFEVAVTGVL